MTPSLTKIFTIPQTATFLDALARAVLNGDLPCAGGGRPEALELTRMTLLLPTRRACRSMCEAFLRVSGGKATLLPRIRPIGEMNEDLNILLSAGGNDFAGDTTLDIPPPVSDIERSLVLSKLVLKWAEVLHKQSVESSDPFAAVLPEMRPSQACLLAGELSRLMDEVETEQVDLSKLDEIVPDDFSHHWGLTLNFLKIVTEMWPNHLQERVLSSPMARRNLLLAAEAERFKTHPPQGPVIAAGITGSIPAAADLLKVVAGLPKGAIVLPGLDLLLDEKSWAQITPHHPEHPQYGMKKLIDKLGVKRDEIAYVTGTAPDELQTARLQFISETMRPAETTEHWQSFIKNENIVSQLKASLANVSLITAPGAQDEAEVISLILRRVADMPGKTAALVTPDRILGRRVSTRLLKWGLMVDDSAGRPLRKTVPGVFMDLIARAVSSQFAASDLMSLLKHPLTRLGMEPGHIRAAARSLELIALRQPLAGQGLAAMRQTLTRTRAEHDKGFSRQGPLGRLGTRDWDRSEEVLNRLEQACAPLLALYEKNQMAPVKTYALAHIDVAEALSLTHESKNDALWAGEAGETLSVFLAGLLEEQIDGPEIAPADYPELYRSLLVGQAMRPQTPVHPRLFIWGPLEARLQQPDVIILGGLNEGTWPQVAQGDPWLSRPMRDSLGLPAPEQRIGLFAHDFAALLGAGEIYLTRAAKVDGVPTVPSRWLLRLQALLKGLNLEKALETRPDEPWLSWARYRDRVEARSPVPPPAPCPPVAARPRQLSVTRIEDWLKNPYTIFARHILKLHPLSSLGVEPDASLRGQVIHQALHRFTQNHPFDVPQDTAEKLVAIADDILAEYAAHPKVAAFWHPRFIRFAEWFAETEQARRAGVVKILTESKGTLSFSTELGAFTLTARADRLDILETGAVIVHDYKTGLFPTDTSVTGLKSPQLPLEAAIILAGGFSGLRASGIAALSYISASGGEPAGQERRIKHDNYDMLADEALAKLKRLVARYELPETPYYALRRPAFDYRYDDYAHLARVAEWSLGEEE